MDLQINELDQIIKFDYVTSVFDIIVISSLKSITLFILISELEILCKDLTFSIKKFDENSSLTNNEVEIVDEVELVVKNLGPEHLRYLKSILHISILLVSTINLIYGILKFSFIINAFINANKMPIDVIFFSIVVVSNVFGLLQLVLSSLSWYFMKKIENAEIKKQENDKNEKTKKFNLKRLLSLAKPGKKIRIKLLK